ncbi:MAG: hypothetical protein Q8M07_29090 [Prosthecobacter sp.]|nr:hypothetical protein [Prosthecobacter sp.]
MLQFKYLAYLAVVCAVLLDLYSGKPGASTALRLSLDGAALILAVIGLGGLAVGTHRVRPRS